MIKPTLMKQLSFFDAKPVKTIADTINAPDDYAFLYTATELGNNSGIKFMMSMEDAMAWCSSDISKGNLHGTAWAYFFTSVKNYVQCRWGTQKPIIDLSKCIDNGEWDKKIALAGCKKIDFHETKTILEKFNIEVICPR